MSENILTRQAGPLPIGGWALLVGGAGVAAYMVSSKNRTTTRTIVDQVPVPVGAVGAVDRAPLVMSPILRVNVPILDQLIDAIGGQTDATKKNTDSLDGNTGAVDGNTDAIKDVTDVIRALPMPMPIPPTTPAPRPAPKPPAAPKPAPAPKTRKYTVKPGDTLSAIAKRYTGNANNWRALYNLNKSAIDASAKRRGKSAPYYNHIVSGQTFKIPASW